VGYQYPVTTNRKKHTTAYLVFGIAAILLVLALLPYGGSNLRLSIVNGVSSSTSTSASTSTKALGGGSISNTSIISSPVVSVFSQAVNYLTSGLVGLAGFIAAGSKLEVLAKSIVTAVVFWGLAYITNLLKYLLYGIAVFSVLVGVLVVLGVV
jgi:hypothetical protein